jgi:hypothetical protein
LPDDVVGAQPTELLGAAVDLRRAASFDAGGLPASAPPEVASNPGNDALARVHWLIQNLPAQCSAGLTAVADALVQGAVDVRFADDPTGEL